jgi:hypothetical protein
MSNTPHDMVGDVPNVENTLMITQASGDVEPKRPSEHHSSKRIVVSRCRSTNVRCTGNLRYHNLNM